MSSIFRSTTALVTVLAAVTLTACAEPSPTGIDANAAFARGSTRSNADAIKLEIALVRPAGAVFSSAKGKAKFATKAGERELQVEVENVPVGTVLTIMVGSSSYSATANALGEARLNVNSRLGQSVPMSVTGAAVTVTSAGGAVVSGGF